MTYAGNAFAFLINALVGLYLIAVMLRVLLQAARADFYNPICQFLVQVTNPALKPMRRLVPGLFGIDLAGVVLLVLIQTLLLLALSWIAGPPLAFPGVVLLAMAELLRLLVYVYVFAIFIMVILSWVGPDPANPVVPLLWRLTGPVLRPFRQLVPTVGGLDLAPMFTIIALLFVVRLVVDPFSDFAYRLATG